MVKALIMHQTGGPEVLRWEDYDPGQPGPGVECANPFIKNLGPEGAFRVFPRYVTLLE